MVALLQRDLWILCLWLLGFNKVGPSRTGVCRVSIMGTCDTKRIYDKSKNLLMVLLIAYKTCLWNCIRYGLSSKIYSLPWLYLLLFQYDITGDRERCVISFEHQISITSRSSWLVPKLFMWDGNSSFLLTWVYAMTKQEALLRYWLSCEEQYWS